MMLRSRIFPFPRATQIGTAEMATAIKFWNEFDNDNLKSHKNARLEVHPRWVHSAIGNSFDGIRVFQTQCVPDRVPSVRVAFD